MMVRSRSIVLVALLLLTCVPSTTADVHGPEIHFDQDDGLVQSSGQVTLSGQANVPLNEITWTVFDVTTADVIASGDFLDTVTPEQEGAWTWTHNISVPTSGCSCRFVVEQGTYAAEIVLYLGSPESWAPVWLDATSAVATGPLPEQMDEDKKQSSVLLTDAGNVSTTLPLTFPPNRWNESYLEVQRCQSSPSGVCKSPKTTISLPIVYDGSSFSVVFHPAEWSPEGHWSITSMVAVDGVLSRSTASTWHLLHDVTPPVAAIEAVASANESERVRLVVNATDLGSEQVTLIDLRVTDPNGEVRVLDQLATPSEAVLLPDLAGQWTVQATVQDGAGLVRVVSHDLVVQNVVPTVNLRFNGAVVESGDTLQVRSGDAFILDASASSDTGNDFIGLNHVWWFGADGRLSGMPELTEDRFVDPGSYDIRIEVVDDDGASAEMAFTLEVIEDTESLVESALVGPLILLLIGAGLTLLFFLRNRSQGPSIPTWPGEPNS
tara:strand:+ start:314 stop:1792 length:1479 start_codon:yes stop_codon:yes gene_type:complete